MANLGVLIEMDGGSVKSANFGVITAARANGDNIVYALVLEGTAGAAREDLAAYGVEKIVQVSVDDQDMAAHPDLHADVLAAALQEYSLSGLLGLSSAKGRDVFSRLAARASLPLAIDCIAVDFKEKTVRKSHFSGKTVATLTYDTDVMLCAIRPNAIEPVSAPVEAEMIAFAPAVADDGRVRVAQN